MKVFVLHYSFLTERKSFMLKQFKDHNITDYDFIELYDVKDIEEIYKKRFDKISLGSASLSLKHYNAYERIATDKEYDEALILEDDAILCDGFMDKLKLYLTQVPKDYDMVFLGDGCNLHIPKEYQTDNLYVYRKGLEPTIWGGEGCSRCTDSYIVSKKCAKKLTYLLNKMEEKIRDPNDFFLNVLARWAKLNVYWVEPTIVTQGSMSGLFTQSYKY